MYLNFDMIFPLVPKLVRDCLLVTVMGLSVSLTGTDRCGNAAQSPREAGPWTAGPADDGGFVVCWLPWSSSCFVIVSVNSDQLKK